MQYEQAYRFLIVKLEQELPVHLTYHNAKHTKDVIEVAKHLCETEKINREQKELLLTAALFHDAGFLKSHNNHEEHSCAMAREILPQFEYESVQIDTVCDLILATKLPQQPTSLLQSVICDSDLCYLGTSHYFASADKLFHEYKHLGMVRDREDWHDKQIAFLGAHKFNTTSAIKEYTSLKKQNLQLLNARRTPDKEHEPKIISVVSDWLMIALGAVTASFGIKGFLEPNMVYDGGVTGISLIVNKLFGIDLSLLIILLNLPILLVNFFGSFKSLVLKTSVGILLLGVCLYFFPHISVTHDKLLVAVFGGFFLGLGSGLAMRGGAALDGTEILALYTIKKTSFTISEIILAFNILIFSVAALAFDLEVALYSILTYFAASQTIGYVIEGIEAYTGVTIISENSEMIKRRLVNELGRGITVYKGERGFLPGNFEVSNDVDIIFTVITRLELRKLKNLVYQTDPKAFVFANTIKEASGGVIKRKDKH